MESQRQKKISILIQKDISNIIQSFFREKVRSTFIVSVTKAKVSPDLSICKIYLSVFPSVNSSSVLSLLNKNKSLIKKRLSGLVRNQLRIIPEIILFFLKLFVFFRRFCPDQIAAVFKVYYFSGSFCFFR